MRTALKVIALRLDVHTVEQYRDNPYDTVVSTDNVPDTFNEKLLV